MEPLLWRDPGAAREVLATATVTKNAPTWWTARLTVLITILVFLPPLGPLAAVLVFRALHEQSSTGQLADAARL